MNIFASRCGLDTTCHISPNGRVWLTASVTFSEFRPPAKINCRSLVATIRSRAQFHGNGLRVPPNFVPATVSSRSRFVWKSGNGMSRPIIGTALHSVTCASTRLRQNSRDAAPCSCRQSIPSIAAISFAYAELGFTNTATRMMLPGNPVIHSAASAASGSARSRAKN